MNSKYIMRILNYDKSTHKLKDLCGTNTNVPMQGLTTIKGCLKRIKKYNLNASKPFLIVDMSTNKVVYDNRLWSNEVCFK